MANIKEPQGHFDSFDVQISKKSDGQDSDDNNGDQLRLKKCRKMVDTKELLYECFGHF